MAFAQRPDAAIKPISTAASRPSFQPPTRQAISPVAMMPQTQGMPLKNFFTGNNSHCRMNVLMASNVSKKLTLIHSIALDQNGPVVMVNASG